MIAALVLAGTVMLAAPAADPALTHARALLKKAILIDGHNDLPWAIRGGKAAPMDLDAVDLAKTTSADTDIPKLRAGEVGAQFWSVYVPGEVNDGHFARVQLEQIDLARRLIAKYPGDFTLCLTADDIVRAHHAGKIGSLLGMEGGHALENSLGALRAYYDLGVRYLTLTHNVTLAWADSAADDPVSDGLSPFGREVVREMNRLGMLVDLSHASPGTMADALDASEAPVIFSHACARALADHARNVPDEILKRLPDNGGVLMVTFVPLFVSREVAAWWAPVWPQVLANPTQSTLRRVREERTKAAGPEPRATLAQVADQIEYVRRVAGADNVGIGGDFPPGAGAPAGLEDVSKYPDLFAELIRRGWSDEDLIKLAGGNLLRAMRKAEAVAQSLRGKPASLATLDATDGRKIGAGAVLELEEAWVQALVRGDEASLSRLLAPGFVYSENARTFTRAEVLAALISGPERVESARNEGMQLHDYGAAAAVTGWLVVSGRGPGGPFTHRYRYTDTWTRGPSGWKLAIAHDYLEPPAGGAP